MPRSDAGSIRRRVLCALQAARTPGFHFPGYFLGFQWPLVTPEMTRMVMPGGAHLQNAAGEADMLAVSVLVDVSLGTAVRALDRTTERLSTVYLQLQLTGVPLRGDVVAESTLLRDSMGTALPQRHSECTLLAGGEEAGYATGAFVCLEKPPEVKLGPLPWQGSDDPLAVPVDEATLSDGEREAMRRCDAQLGATGGAFLEPFWMDPIAPGDDAVLTIATGPHTGNRVGHVQGGLLVGFAARAGVNAAPSSMRLSSISAWFVSPGRGKLRVRSQALHRGRNTALFRNVVETDAGQTVLESVTQHVLEASS